MQHGSSPRAVTKEIAALFTTKMSSLLAPASILEKDGVEF